MVGLIWFVQLVHYPLFHLADRERFPQFEAAHMVRTAQAVSIPMVLEAGTAITLLSLEPSYIPRSSLAIGFALLLIIWISTFLIQTPLHTALERGYDEEIVKKLIRSNWTRTLAWTLRGFLLCLMLSTRF